jgi:hypothetical protein
MLFRPRALWIAFLRLVIVFLALVLAVVLYLSFNPSVLVRFAYKIPGVVDIPKFDPLPLPPVIDAPQGEVPTGTLAYEGFVENVGFSCGFLLWLDAEHRVGVATAHALAPVPYTVPAEFNAPDGERVARLKHLVQRGETFQMNHLAMDYSLWEVDSVFGQARYLTPDPRGMAQVGERIIIYDPFDNSGGSSRTWEGTVMRVDPEATWIQMDEVFNPAGLSGCPTVSQYTGQAVGMVIAGTYHRDPTIIGLHPIGSIVEKIKAGWESAK